MIGRSSDWIQHALKRSAWRPQRQVVALATLGFFIALILGALYLTQVASEATTNRHLEELLDERDDLERINEELRAEIAQLKSVGNLQARAEAVGFTLANQDQILYLPVAGYVPGQANPVAPVASVESQDITPDVYDETFGDWLGRQWQALREKFGG
jgi:hypothetical protein